VWSRDPAADVERFYGHLPSTEQPSAKATEPTRFLKRGTNLAIEEKTFVRHNADSGTPMKRIPDSSFRYTRSIDTDLRKTFARIRREQQQQTLRQAEVADTTKVLSINERKHAAAS